MNTATAWVDCAGRNDLGGNEEDTRNLAEFQNRRKESDLCH